jgi:hypothetical protein
LAWKSLAGAGFGAALIVAGVVAIARQRAKASPEGEDERPYEGGPAVLLGALWVVMGAAIATAALAPKSTGGLVGFLRRIGGTLLGD